MELYPVGSEHCEEILAIQCMSFTSNPASLPHLPSPLGRLLAKGCTKGAAYTGAVTTTLLHVDQSVQLRLNRVCLCVQHRQLAQGGCYKGFLWPWCPIRLTVCARGRAGVVQRRHAPRGSCCQVLVVAVLREGQQLLRDFRGHVVFLIGKLRFVTFIILSCSFHNDQEGLPGGVLIVYRGVPPERGLVGEGPATGVAHEGLLPGVNAVVPLQRVQLRELLPTLVTAVGPLPCVYFYMLVKRVPLCERPEANFTLEGLGASVDSVVVFQVLLRGKALSTRLTHERPFPYSTGEKEN